MEEKSKTLRIGKDNYKDLTFSEVYKSYKNLIYSQVKHWSGILDPADVESAASFGLFKAYNAYDLNRTHVVFGYYAKGVISNEVLMLNRKEKRRKECETSMDNILSQDADGSTLSLIDIIPSLDNVEDDVMERMGFNGDDEKLLVETLCLFPESKIKFAMEYAMGKTQGEAAIACGMSQSYGSRILRQIGTRFNKLKNKNPILKGGNKMSKKTSISKEELKERAEEMGFSWKAKVKIAEEFGVSPTTIHNLYRRYGIGIEDLNCSSESSEKEDMVSELKECVADDIEEIEEKTAISEKEVISINNEQLDTEVHIQYVDKQPELQLNPKPQLIVTEMSLRGNNTCYHLNDYELTIIHNDKEIVVKKDALGNLLDELHVIQELFEGDDIHV